MYTKENENIVYLNVGIKPELKKRVTEFSKRNGLYRYKVVELALEEYLLNHERKK
jgi:hypothetical protein